MAALTTATLYSDGADVVPVTFSPLTRVDGVATWVDFSVADVDLRPSMTLSITQPKSGGVVGRVKGKITMPYLAADGITKRTAFVNLEAVLPTR